MPSVALTMGMFDGVHLGHRRVVETLVAEARRIGGSAALLTFDPHPRKLLGGEEGALLMSVEHRLRLLKGFGLDFCIVTAFDRAMARQEAGAFVTTRLLGAMRLRLVCVGEGFAFGSHRGGDVKLLRSLGAVHGFTVTVVAGVRVGGMAVSSTAIRRLIAGGEIGKASLLLGRPYSIFGSVVRGKALGRKLGIPTANLSAGGELLPPPGVYTVQAVRGDGLHCGVMNIDRRGCVEVHLFDFNDNLYGEQLELIVGKKLREEREFGSVKELAEQIRCDIAIARQMLHNKAVIRDKG